MGAVENVLVAAAARHRCDLAAVEADADVAQQLRLRRRGGFPDGAAQVETCARKENDCQSSGKNGRHVSAVLCSGLCKVQPHQVTSVNICAFQMTAVKTSLRFYADDNRLIYILENKALSNIG